jgi:hypothetical protein
MSDFNITIGAPSLNDGANYHEAIKAGIKADFPCQVTFKNNMPCSLSIPQGNGLALKAVGHDGSDLIIAIASMDELLRIATDIETIAGLNNFASAVELSVSEPVSEPVAQKTPTKKAATQTTEVAGG